MGYTLAAVAFLILALLLVLNFRQRLRGLLLAGAALATVIWAGAYAVSSTWFQLAPFHVFVLEFSHDAAWLIFLSGLLSGAVGGPQFKYLRYAGVFVVASILIVGAGWEVAFQYGYAGTGASRFLVMGSLLTALAGLIGVEQIYRNARESQRRGLRFLCLGVGAMFAYDLFLYSNAILVGEISPLFWSARGYVVALCMPLIALAVGRSPAWSTGVFVSRQIVFYSATVFGAGVYLTIIGFTGYYIRTYSTEWGPLIQVVFFSAAVISLFVFLFSDLTRARLRVFISKHFFENKYDYRQEWLRLIETLTSAEEALPLKKRAIKALAQIIDAPSGLLWLSSPEAGEFRVASNWNTNAPSGCLAADASLPEFLRRSGWIVDVHEYHGDPSHYGSLELSADELGLEHPAFVIPLFNDADLLGFITLSETVSGSSLNYEDRDLLKTAGMQVASYLAQEQANERLAQGRQFEAYNRLTAYIMHDLKNVIAQQSLVVDNAQKHKNNPEFVEDAIETIKGGVVRMRRVIEQLKQSSVEHTLKRVEVNAIIEKAVSQCADHVPVPKTKQGKSRVWVRADPERLQMAVVHSIRNAQDATEPDGDVSVHLSHSADECRITVTDTGCGMDEAFVHERLFKPFDSTKGTQGMGIGAYQIRAPVQSIGGSVDINSVVGRGTTIVLTLKTDVT